MIKTLKKNYIFTFDIKESAYFLLAMGVDCKLPQEQGQGLSLPLLTLVV